MIAVNLNRRVLSLESGASEMRELVRAFYGTLENAAACGVIRRRREWEKGVDWLIPIGDLGRVGFYKADDLRRAVEIGGVWMDELKPFSRERVYCHYLPSSSVSGGAAIS